MPTIYQTSVEIPSFGGINQSTDGYNMSMRYATTAYNADVTGGGLAPMMDGKEIAQSLTEPIGTLARLYRRYNAVEGERSVLVAVSGGRIWTKLLDHDDAWVARHGGLKCDKCDFVTYEVNRHESPAPVDVLLLTNAEDGMLCLYGDDLHVEPVNTPYKFGVLARHNERIWGTGIVNDPDKLVYSAAFDPFDWKPNAEIPEDGSGEIMQPSWDGDSFLALRPFGSQLLAIKKNAIWRILGTNPGEFIMKEQYGGGALEENTVVVTGSDAYMLGYGGIMRYDGADASPFQQEAVREIMAQVNPAARAEACATMDGKTYLLALPMGASETNNTILMYNITQQAFSLMRGVGVKAFLAFEDRVFYTSAQAPGRVFELGAGKQALPLTWQSGYQDLGAKSSVKSNFGVYLMLDGETMTPVTLRIRTEKKAKEKMVLLTPGKPKRVTLNALGRYFRLEIQSKATKPWRICGGVQIDCELDPD